MSPDAHTSAGEQVGAASTPAGESFEMFVRAIAPELLAYFGRRVSPSEDAADCLGETLLVLWRRRDAFPVAHSDRRAWTYGIAHHVLKGHRRSATRRIGLTERLRQDVRVSTQFGAHSEDDAALDAFARLSEADREILGLTVWEGFSLADTAEIVGIRPEAARARYSRARQRMRRLLAQGDGVAG
ncbi:RNA polymerase sigma-70 factor (ECF subfamily) [Agromyces sp. 3263]|uniref:RNA polymerase sigma factor n=1 Tax=Agromyces sp. 3263 TaxID=2817750 RepID=UPI0028641056|nr:sigma-70 family RNA polymerase sigma factor [Agromyces sp. 3263]MDR6907783.1 RNA polymerase sigma-70 factor (ECF subfamily) [Agromyces sp. 3263]